MMNLTLSDYYVTQLHAGDWYICDYTQHQWNGLPNLPREYDHAYQTPAAACPPCARPASPCRAPA